MGPITHPRVLYAWLLSLEDNQSQPPFAAGAARWATSEPSGAWHIVAVRVRAPVGARACICAVARCACRS